MTICVTAAGSDLDAPVDPRFGRAAWFVIVDTETMNFEPVQNPNVSVGGGAGIQAAQMVAERGVEAVLTGNCGPNAFAALSAANVQIFTGVGGTVRQAVEQYKAGAFASNASPNVGTHFGTGGGQGMGGGQGKGRGQGMGGGQGMGRGQGMGGGRGAGRM